MSLQLNNLKIDGLKRDNYLINNPILVTVSNFPPIVASYSVYYSIKMDFINTETGKSIYGFEYFLNRNQVKLTTDISKAVKAVFSKPDFTDNKESRCVQDIRINIDLMIQSKNTNEVKKRVGESLVKTFVRAGRREWGSNFYYSQLNILGSALLPQNYRPFWEGLPSDVSHFQNGEIVSENSTGFFIKQEKLRKKTCDGAYLAFLNSKGGYSYWYFETVESKTSANNMGFSQSIQEYKDLGSEYENEQSFISKVPDRYMPTMVDLVNSPDVWIYEENNNWSKIKLKGNEVTEANKDVKNKVKIKAEILNKYNPSLLW